MLRSLIIAGFGLLGGTAFAADVYTQPDSFKDAPVPAPTWAGAYVGVDAGTTRSDYEDGKISVEAEPGFDGTIGAYSYGGLPDETYETTFGIHAGYNWQWGWKVFGFEAAVATGDSDIDYIGSFRARAGFAFGNFLIYGSGGLSFGSLEDNFSVSRTGFTTTGKERSDETNFGYVAGGGGEYKISDNVSVGVEGLYHRFNDYNSEVTLREPAPGTDEGTFRTDAEQDFWVIRGRLNYHFQPDAIDMPLK